MNPLRHNSIVEAWIAAWQAQASSRVLPDCLYCGWPHYENILCRSGATFGMVRLGENNYYIDDSNVEFMLNFVTNTLGPGFHWKYEIYFDVKDGNVIVSHLEQFNNYPQSKRWTIPLREWQSITDFVAAKVPESATTPTCTADAMKGSSGEFSVPESATPATHDYSIFDEVRDTEHSDKPGKTCWCGFVNPPAESAKGEPK